HNLGETEEEAPAPEPCRPSPAGEMTRDIGGDTVREELTRPADTVNTPAVGAVDTVDTSAVDAVDVSDDTVSVAVDTADDTVSVAVDAPTDIDPSLARKISLATDAVRLRQEKGLTWSDAAK